MTDTERYVRDLVDSCKDYKGGFDREVKWLAKDLEGKIVRAVQRAEKRSYRKGYKNGKDSILTKLP